MANKWTIEQQLAIDKQNSNILVSASAGSGKTAVLVERVINKVINYNIDIDRILVVTFTNASAIELKERLLMAIYKELDKDQNNVFLKRQLQYINRASITTIHSFCLDIIRQNFYLLNLDPNFKICDDSKSIILKTTAMNNIFEKKYEEYNEKKQETKLYKVLRLFSGKEENMIEILLKIYSYILSFDYPLEWLKTQIEKYNFDQKDNVNIDLAKTEFGVEIYKDAINDIELIEKRTEDAIESILGNEDFVKYVEMLDNDLNSIRICKESKTWDELFENLNQVAFSRAPGKFAGNNVELKDSILNFRTDVVKETIKRLCKSIYAKSEVIVNDNKNAYGYIEYIYDILVEFDLEYKRLKEEENLIDFSDIEHLAFNLLVKKDEDGRYVPSNISTNLRNKFIEVYTDEYQDTSYIQEAILESIATGNNRFMVGDIKQSIYRFRQAMPEIFNNKYDKFIGQENNEFEKSSDCKIILAQNFRSRVNVIDSINYIFERIMSKENGDCNYDGLEKLKFGATLYKENEDVNYKTEFNIIDLSKIEDLNSNIEEDTEENTSVSEDSSDEVLEYINELKDFEIESLFIAKKIEELVGNFETYDIKSESFKKATYKDIVILLRGIKDKGRILEETLKKYNIPAFCDATTSLFESDEIKLVLSFLRVISNPLQDIDMVSVMYSILGNFSLTELTYLRNFSTNENIYYNIKNKIKQNEEISNLDEEQSILQQKLIDFDNLLTKFIELSRISKVSELITMIYKETNIYYQFSVQKSAKLKKANLELLIDYAIKFENESKSNIDSYISYIDKLIENPSDSSAGAKILGENENVVRIMTIHKSKGLEFPIVILCDTSKKYNIRDSYDYITLHSKLGIGINVVNDEYNVTFPSVIKQAIKIATVKETKSEELRMLYVALTRAKEKLIIFGTVKDYNKKIESMLVMYKDNKIDPVLVSKNSTYFDNILMSLNNYNSQENKFDINVINDFSKIIKVDDSENELDFLNIDSENLNKDLKEIKDEDIVKIKNHVEYIYPYSDDLQVKQRVSVSELKQITDADDEAYYNEESIKLEFDIPKCIDDKKEFSGAKKGTLIHFILEHLDFNSINSTDDLDSQIQILYNKGIINSEDLENIEIKKIYNFVNSKIGKDLKLAKQIFREEEFILKDETISKSVIQGIIDLYYIDQNDKIILVDFKTDRLSKTQDFIDRYENQLNIYKKAIEKLYKTKVEKVYVYSFNLNCEIEI